VPDTGLGPALNYIGVVPLCGLLFWAFMREWIVPGSRLRRVEADRARWEKVALEALGVSATVIVPAAETVHALVSKLPDPALEKRAEETTGGDSP
jgi:hypothetical protein